MCTNAAYSSYETHRPSWQVIAASVQGTSHAKVGQPCQDASHWAVRSNGLLIAAVADGAGSAPLGEIGAVTAVQTAVTWLSLSEHLLLWPTDNAGWQATLLTALEAAQQALATVAAEHQQPLHHFATTLILVMATPHLVAVAQVGDGAAVLGDRGGKIHSLTIPSHGEYANETTFLVETHALSAAQVSVWHGELAHLALFSDGLERLALDVAAGWAAYAPFFTPLFRFVDMQADAAAAQARLAQFLDSPRLRTRTDDDCTLMLISCTA